jgi:hypothetical protein
MSYPNVSSRSFFDMPSLSDILLVLLPMVAPKIWQRRNVIASFFARNGTIMALSSLLISVTVFAVGMGAPPSANYIGLGGTATVKPIYAPDQTHDSLISFGASITAVISLFALFVSYLLSKRRVEQSF